jgi:hypothetical protein
MIDFRYHLVTIIAIFLALAVGIVVGTTALNGAVTTNLHHDVAGLQAEKAKLLGENDTAAAALALDTKFASELEPVLLPGALTGRRVAVVGLPGTTPGDRSAMSTLLQQAGADVVAQLGFTPTVVAPASSSLLAAVSQDAAPPGMSLPTGQPVQAAAEVLAAGLTGRTSTGIDPSPLVVTAAFSSYGLLTEDVRTRSTARLVVLVAPPGPASPPASAPAQKAAQAGVTLSTDLAQALAAVHAAVEVVGPVSSDAPGGLLSGVRGALTHSVAVSTVDGTDTPQGQIAAVFALRAAQTGITGRYGVTPGEIPLPAPSPSASTSASTSGLTSAAPSTVRSAASRSSSRLVAHSPSASLAATS